MLEDLRENARASGSAEFASLSLRERGSAPTQWHEGKTTKQIAAALKVSKKTVDNHRAHLMSKLKATTLAELIKFAIREGLTSVSES